MPRKGTGPGVATVRVDYALTPLGRTLMPLVAHIKEWAECHMDEVAAARAGYDAAPAR